MMDWFDLILGVGSIALAIFAYFKGRINTKAMDELKQNLANKKILYVICPKCGNKIYLTIENVKEENDND